MKKSFFPGSGTIFLACVMALLAQSAIAETVTVGGVGAITPLVTKLAEQFGKQNPDISVVIMIPPLGSAGGLRALAAGKMDIALSGRKAKENETGNFYPWLRTPMVLATSDGKAAKGLSKKEIAEIYAGSRTQWADGSPIRVVLRAEIESETKAFRSLSPEIDSALGVAYTRPGLPVAENDLDALSQLVKIKGSLGTTSLGLIKSEGVALKPLGIDGQMPSIAALDSGKYPLYRSFYLVTGNSPKPAATAFLNYLKSAQVLKEAAKLEFGPAPRD